MRLRVIVHALDHSARLAACASLLLTAAGRPPAASRAAALTPGAPPPLYLPFIASAGSEIAPSLAGLIPPGVGVVLAEADALGEHAAVTAAGAAVLFLDQQVAVLAPAGAYTETVALTLRGPAGPETAAADVDTPALAFTLEARTAAGAEAVPIQPLRLVADLRARVNAAGGAWYLEYQDPDEPALWHRPEVTVHDAAGLISVETRHFSNWQAGAEPEPWKLKPVLPAVSAFSGAATFQYPVAVPPGRAGLTPNVDVSYSSRALDGLITSTDEDQGPLGLGWSVAGAEVTRRGVFTASGSRGPVLVYPDLFSLALNGQSYNLFPAAGADPAHDARVRYTAENGPSLLVERVFDRAAPNADKLYWMVKTADGTTYRFGYTPDAEAVQIGGETAAAGHPGASEATPLRWLVDTVTDLSGNQLQYDYAAWPKREGGLTTDGVRPAEIRYNFSAPAPDPLTRVPGPAASRLVFALSDNHRLKQIQIYQVDQARPVRTVTFGLEAAAYTGPGNCGQTSATQIVTSIQETGADGAARLPAVSLRYQALAHAGTCYPFLYLSEVENGYGGRLRFTYDHDGRVEDVFGADRPPAYGRTYFVTRVETWDAVTTAPAVTAYDYARPCYDNGGQLGRLAGAFDCVLQTPAGVPGYGPHIEIGGLAGFGSAAVTAYDYGRLVPLNRTVTAFSQVPLSVGQVLRAETQAWDGRAWNGVQAAATTYETAAIDASGAQVSRVRAAEVSTFDGGGTVTSRREHTRYDRYGNLEELVEYDGAGRPYRRTLSTYAAGTAGGLWVTGALTRQQVFAWEGAGWAAAPARETRFDYNADGDPATAAPDARGRLTAQREWAGGERFVDTLYTYDLWGRRQTTTSFGAYGDTAHYAGADPRVARTDYGPDLFALYAVTVTNPLGHQLLFEYDARLGTPLSVRDPNQAVTRYAYDPFGRLTAVARPGDSLALPTVRYVYTAGAGGLNRTETYQRETSGCAACERLTVEFYDGLGRLVQTRTPAAPGQQAVADTVYDPLGRAVAVYLPELQPAGLDFTRAAGWEARPRTTTAYDALGRAVRVTGPDGASGQTAFRGPLTASLDAAGHQRLVETDAFGRTTAVLEYQAAGLSAPDFDQPPYARTTYAYTVRDQLTRVETLTATTVITYNVLGQKIEIADPDMGAWRYDYWPSGELAAQTDARGVVTQFTYDALGRPTRQAYQVPAGLGVLDPGPVSYAYDEGGAAAQAIGQRTSRQDATGTAAWTYDARGRVTSERRQFAFGLGDATIGYAYNAADQLIQITYPDGEQVTTALDPAGRPAALTSSAGETFVAVAGYDAQSRLAQLTLGNALTTTYAYYPPEAAGQGGRLQRLSVGAGLLDLAYTYDLAGNITSLRDASRVMDTPQTAHFTYDGLDRLTAAWTTGGAAGYVQAYQYDPLGRPTARTTAGQTADYAYADPAHLHAATQAGGDRYVYDAAGNMILRQAAGVTYTQTWTAASRLAQVTWSAAGRPYTTTFAYDGDGRRTLKIEDDGAAAITTLYLAGVYEQQVNTTGQDLPSRLYPPPAGGRRSAGLARPARRDYTGPGDRTIATWVPPVYGWTGDMRVSASAPSCTNKPAYPVDGTQCGDPPVMYTAEECAGVPAPCQAGEMYHQTSGGYTATVTYAPAQSHASVACTLGWSGWCLNAATLTLWGSDPIPGQSVYALSYSLASSGLGSQTAAVNPRVVSFGDTAPVNVYFWGESTYGDQSIMGLIPMKVDTQPPTLLVGGPAPGAWQTVNSAITYSLSDALSGAHCVRAAWEAWPADDGQCAVTAGSTLIPGEGAHTLYLRGWDNAGQPVTWSGTYYYDATPPVLSGGAATPCAADSLWQNSCNTPAFTWPAAADPVSGLAGYDVYWGLSPAGTGGPRTVSAAYAAGSTLPGTRYLRVRAVDQAGNASAWTTLFTFKYDAAPPVVTAALVGAAGDSGWYRSTVTVTLTVSDDLSGAAAAQWRLEGGAWTSYTGPFTVAAEGWHTLDYRAQDAAGNWSAPGTQAVNIDLTPPSLAAAAASEVSQAGVADGIWQNRVAAPRFTWAGAADALTGPPAGYRVAWGPDPAGVTPSVETISAEFTAGPAAAGDTLYLRVQARDQAGLWSEWRTLFTFRFDNQAPMITDLWPADGQVLTTTLPVISAAFIDALPGAGLAAPTLALDQQVVEAAVVAGRLVYTPTQPLLPGPHTLLLNVPDQAGNLARLRRTFWVDPDTTLRIVSPPNGAVLNEPQTEVVLEGEPSADVTVIAAGQVITGKLDAGGRWETTLAALPAGETEITAQARDAAGNTAVAAQTVLVDSQLDAAAVEAERAAVNVRQAPALFYVTAQAGAGRALERWALEVRAAGGALTAALTGEGPADHQAVLWEGRLPSGAWAADGSYTAQVVLTTTTGLTRTSAALPFTLASTAPAVPEVECGPGGEIWFSQPPALARGTAPAGTQVVLYQDDVPQFTAPVFDLRWQQPISITAGAPFSVTVTARALDAAGNLSAASAPCRLGLSQSDPFIEPHASLAPSFIGLDATVLLTVTTRAYGAPLTAAGVRVDVPAALGAPALQVAGRTAEAQTWTGVWRLPAAGLWQAPAAVIFSADDTAQPSANHGEQFLQPYVDLVPPFVRTTWPWDGFRQAEAHLVLQGLAEPFSTVTVTARRQSDAALTVATAPADAAGLWQGPLTLADGVYQLTAQAQDRAGNLGVAADPVEVTIDTAGPVLGDLSLAPAFAQPGQTVTVSVPIQDEVSRVAAVAGQAHDLQQPGESVPILLQPAAGRYAGALMIGDDAAEGMKLITVAAVDELGNSGRPAGAALIVDGTPPAVSPPLWNANGPLLETAGPIAYYGPRTTGTLMLTIRAGDEAGHIAAAGLGTIQFPDLFGLDGALTALPGPEASADYIHIYTPTGVVSGTFAVQATDRAGNQAAARFEVRYDDQSPAVTLQAPAQAGLRFSVSWAGADGGAGLAGYDVQYREVGAPAWTGWLTQTLTQEQDFIGQAGRVYEFRARAVDRVGNAAEWQTARVAVAAVVKYYLFSGQRLVMRQGTALYYLHGDHLGSASLVTDAGGNVVSQARYLPYGQTRLAAGAGPSDFGFTAQRQEDFGLLDYNARYYDPALGQFISPDPVAPNVLSAIAFNRFAYTLDNPVKYIDPSGFSQKLCGEKCEAQGGHDGNLGRPVDNADQLYRLTADQYALLAIFAESSNGSHPDIAIYLMSWVAQNSIGQAKDAFEYADKLFYGMRDILRAFLPPTMQKTLGDHVQEFSPAFKKYLYHKAYVWYSRQAFRGENGFGDEFDKVVALYSSAQTDRTNGAADPTNGSTMFNHASFNKYDRTSWVTVGAGGIQSPEQFVAVLSVNFDKYRSQRKPDFTYSFYIYPADWPEVGGMVLVTGNKVCIQGWNGCGAYLP